MLIQKVFAFIKRIGQVFRFKRRSIQECQCYECMERKVGFLRICIAMLLIFAVLGLFGAPTIKEVGAFAAAVVVTNFAENYGMINQTAEGIWERDKGEMQMLGNFTVLLDLFDLFQNLPYEFSFNIMENNRLRFTGLYADPKENEWMKAAKLEVENLFPYSQYSAQGKESENYKELIKNNATFLSGNSINMQNIEKSSSWNGLTEEEKDYYSANIKRLDLAHKGAAQLVVTGGAAVISAKELQKKLDEFDMLSIDFGTDRQAQKDNTKIALINARVNIELLRVLGETAIANANIAGIAISEQRKKELGNLMGRGY